MYSAVKILAALPALFLAVSDSNLQLEYLIVALLCTYEFNRLAQIVLASSCTFCHG